jgi:hypothetical protein
MTTKLTPAQRKRLAGLSEDWRQEDDGWKAGRVFLDLEARGFCEMDSRRVKGGSIMTGPGNTSVYRWFTRRTQRGTNALADDYSRRTIEATQRATA